MWSCENLRLAPAPSGFFCCLDREQGSVGCLSTSDTAHFYDRQPDAEKEEEIAVWK